MTPPRCCHFAVRRAARAVGAWTALGASGLRVDTADPQLDSAHPYCLETVESLFRHALWKIHKAVVVADVDVPDVAAVNVRFVRDGADDISGLDAVCMTDFDAVRFEPRALPGTVGFPGL